MGPIFDGAGLNMTVMSYNGVVYFGLVCCPDVVSTIERVVRGIEESTEELLSAVDRLAASTKPGSSTVEATKSTKRSSPVPTAHGAPKGRSTAVNVRE